MAREISDVIAQVQAIPEGQVYSKPVHDAITKVESIATFADLHAFVRSEEVRNGNAMSSLHRNLNDVPQQEGRKYQDFIQRLGRLRPLPVRTIDYI